GRRTAQRPVQLRAVLDVEGIVEDRVLAPRTRARQQEAGQALGSRAGAAHPDDRADPEGRQGPDDVGPQPVPAVDGDAGLLEPFLVPTPDASLPVKSFQDRHDSRGLRGREVNWLGSNGGEPMPVERKMTGMTRIRS